MRFSFMFYRVLVDSRANVTRFLIPRYRASSIQAPQLWKACSRRPGLVASIPMAGGNEHQTGDLDSENSETLAMDPQAFQQTHWSVVVRAQDTQKPDAREAMSFLCRSYWYPLYFFVRRKYGKSHHEAEDLTQGFFTELISKGHVKSADRDRGKFRTFLLTYFENFLSNEWRKNSAEKRGGGQCLVSIDQELAEKKFAAEPADETTPEDMFDRKWALNVFELGIDDLRADYAGKGKETLFDAIKPHLAWNSGEASHAEIAAQTGLSEGAIRVEIHRMRKRFRNRIHNQIAQTVTTPEEVETELRYLCSLLV